MHELVKKLKKIRQSPKPPQHRNVAGLHLLMGCSTSAVQNAYCKLDERSCSSGDVPKGCLAVYVGDERQRYIIRAHLLNHPIFRALLEKSARELGFQHNGGLTIACDARDFEQLLWLVKKGDSAILNLKMAELVDCVQ